MNLSTVAFLALATAACGTSVTPGDASSGDALDGSSLSDASMDVSRLDAVDVATTPDVSVLMDVTPDSVVIDAVTDRPAVDVPTDVVTPTDVLISMGEAGITCGSMTCTGSNLCCASFAGGMISYQCAATCSDASVPLACDGPEDCNSNPCCLTVSGLGAGMSLSGAMCSPNPMACDPMVTLATRSAQTRRCHIDGDCTFGTTGSRLPNCCTLPLNGSDEHVCFSAGLIGLVPGGHCP